MSAGINVLGIPLFTLEDLVRLVVMIRRENSFLLCYPTEGGRFVVGSYLTSVGKNVVATFPHITTEEKPPSIVSFTSDLNGREKILMEHVSSAQFFTVSVSYLLSSPHREIEPKEVECAFSRAPVDSLLSLVKLGVSTSTEDFMPFVWYDQSRRKFVLSVKTKGSEETDDGVMLFDYASEGPDKTQKYIRYRAKNGHEELEFTTGIADYSSKYVAIINVMELPYYHFERK
ncbi:MAG: hypothetical protein ACE5GD_06205 [Candidatus Geothermarchaeales archaeon]